MFELVNFQLSATVDFGINMENLKSTGIPKNPKVVSMRFLKGKKQNVVYTISRTEKTSGSWDPAVHGCRITMGSQTTFSLFRNGRIIGMGGNIKEGKKELKALLKAFKIRDFEINKVAVTIHSDFSPFVNERKIRDKFPEVEERAGKFSPIEKVFIASESIQAVGVPDEEIEEYIEEMKAILKKLGVTPSDKSAYVRSDCPLERKPRPYSFKEGKCPNSRVPHYIKPNPQGRPCCYKVPKRKVVPAKRVTDAYSSIKEPIPQSVRNVFGDLLTQNDRVKTKLRLRTNALNKRAIVFPRRARMSNMVNGEAYGGKKIIIKRSEWRQLFGSLNGFPTGRYKVNVTKNFLGRSIDNIRKLANLRMIRATGTREQILNRLFEQRLAQGEVQKNPLEECKKKTKAYLKAEAKRLGVVLPRGGILKATLCKLIMAKKNAPQQRRAFVFRNRRIQEQFNRAS